MKKLIVLLLVALAVFLGVVGFLLYNTYNEIVEVDYIYPGVEIGGVSVSGLNKQQAVDKLNATLDGGISGKKLLLKYNEYSIEVTPEDLGFKWNTEKAVDEAFALGRSGNPYERYMKVKSLANGVIVGVGWDYDESRISDIVRNTGLVINREPEEGEFEFLDGKIIAHDGKPGFKINEELLTEELKRYASELVSQQDFVTIELTGEEVKPEKDESYARINGIIGEFSTSLKGSTPERIHNVRHSMEAISGKLLKPGETLSFNELTGLRTKKNGYKDASVIINGKYEDGTGGGVCQTSTTLYNALIHANLMINERHNHSIPSSYVPLGLDAAVNDTNMDLKFTNEYDFPVFIFGKLENITLTFYVYGDTSAMTNKYKFDSVVLKRVEPEVIETLDETLPDNTKELVKDGKPGLNVVSYRYIYDKDGELVDKEVLNKDYYKKIDYEYKVGRKVIVPIITYPRETYNDEPSGEAEGSKPAEDDFPYVNPDDPNNYGDSDKGEGY